MLQRLLIFMFALFSLNATAQTKTLVYSQSRGTTAGEFPTIGCETTIDYLTTCQTSISAQFTSLNYGNGVWSNGNFEYYVNGILRGTGNGTSTIDLTAYLPITSIKIKKTNQSNWNVVDLKVMVQSPSVSMPASDPIVSNRVYCIGNATTPLTATLTNGCTSLKWYTSNQGAGYSLTAPTPSTANPGQTKYWVAQVLPNGCESERDSITVSVYAMPPAPIVTNYTFSKGLLADTLKAIALPDAKLIWYKTDTSSVGDTIAPIPNTDSAGIFSYWVAQKISTCISVKAKIDVTVLNVTKLSYSDSVRNDTLVLKNISTCQQNVFVKLRAQSVYGNSAYDAQYDYYVDGVLAGTGYSEQVINISQFIPIDSVMIVKSYTSLNSVVSIDLSVYSNTSLQLAAPTVTSEIVACAGSVVNLSATKSTSAKSLIWYTEKEGKAGTFSTPVVPTDSADTLTYYVSQIDSSNCESARAMIKVIIKARPTSPIVEDVFYLQGEQATALTAISDGDLIWYNSDTSTVGSSIAPIPSTLVQDTLEYWVSAIIDGCESERVKITVLIYAVKTLPYIQNAGITGAQYYAIGCETSINYLTTCQQKVKLVLTSLNYGNGIWSDGNYEYYINDALAGSGNGTDTIDVSQYIPIRNIKIKKTNYANWNVVEIKAYVTSFVNLFEESVPTAADTILYCKGTSSREVNASLNGNGKFLKWYSNVEGLYFSLNAPTPNTSKVDTFTYYVAQADTFGCESERVKTVVVVNDFNPGIVLIGDSLKVDVNNANYQWYICESNNTYTPIASGNTQSIAYEAGKRYSALVSIEGCEVRTSCMSVAATGLLQESQDEFLTVYPNPSANVINIELSENASESSYLVIRDVTGRIVMQENVSEKSFSIDISTLSNSSYYIELINNEKTFRAKILKQ